MIKSKISILILFSSILNYPLIQVSSAQERQRYLVKHKGGEIEFALFRLPGDGDCALHGLEKTRKEFIEALERKTGDPSIQEILREDLFEKKYIPTLNAPITEAAIHIFVKERLSRSIEFLTFVGQWQLSGQIDLDLLSQDNSLQVSGTLAAAAKLFGLNVRVWNPDSEKGLTLLAKFVNTLGAEFIDLLHRGCHYDRLVPINDLMMAQRFLDKEIEHKQNLFGYSGPSIYHSGFTKPKNLETSFSAGLGLKYDGASEPSREPQENTESSLNGPDRKRNGQKRLPKTKS